ncbi:MAG: integrase [Alphaproteobacteria bacterium]|nr:MAG: integrase [Alphaproteobacteria bacterium]
MKLSAIQVKNAKPKDRDYKLFDGEGLFLLVKKSGKKSWRLKYYFLGAEKLIVIGPYPIVSLQEARDARLKARKLIHGGIDPVAHRIETKDHAIRNADNTFQAIAYEWYENRKDMWTPRYADNVIKRLEEDIFPYIGKLPIKDIEPPLLLDVIRKIEKRGALDLARRQLQKCGEIFRYGIAIGRAVRDPSADIKEALKPSKKDHFAALDVSELPEFLKAIENNDARLYRSTRNALRLMLLTFVRTSELINARWEEINFDRKEWVIPAERMKMRKVHIVPLSKQAIALLKDQKEIAGEWPLVFPSSVRPAQSISNNTILGAIKRLGYKGRMTGHGFRALAMSAIKQELGYRHEVVDRQLAHAPRNKIDQAYDRAQFLDERRVMMQDWSNFVDKCGANDAAL